MCYAYKPAALPGIQIPAEALPAETAQGFYFAKDSVPVFLADGTMRLMRWDLIPRGFLKNEPTSIAEAIRKKNSRAINPATGKSWGFSSYNARLETVDTLWAFKDSWRDGNRGVIPVESFRERPNMEEAPAEARGREFEIVLPARRYLAVLHDTWTAVNGEAVESCTVITGPSDEVPEVRAIWHERVPILLTTEAARTWLAPATSGKAAKALLLAAKPPPLTVREVPKSEKTARRNSGQADKTPDLFTPLENGDPERL